jgi:hypothetical protein
MRSYLVRDTWFPSHLLLEGTRSYLDFLVRNRWPTVPWVQDPDATYGSALDQRTSYDHTESGSRNTRTEKYQEECLAITHTTCKSS